MEVAGEPGGAGDGRMGYGSVDRARAAGGGGAAGTGSERRQTGCSLTPGWRTD